MNKKIVTFTVAMVLLLGVTLGLTFALMFDNTGTVTNTFVAGGFGQLKLWETLDGGNGTLTEITTTQNNEYTMFPGGTITKDPQISFVREGYSGSYVVFMKVDGAGWTLNEDGAVYSIDSVDLLSFGIQPGENGEGGWSLLTYDNANDEPVATNIYYQIFDADIAVNSKLHFIEEDKVTVDEGATLDLLAQFKADSENKLTLSFTAYAVQYSDGDDVLNSFETSFYKLQPEVDEGV